MKLKSMLTAAALTALLAGPALAVEEHHEAPGVQTPQAAQAAPGQAPGAGMMGGMMPMMGMMGQGMMPMMGQGTMGPMAGPGRMGMAAPAATGPMGPPAMVDRIEGRIAFLRAELKIAEAQSPAWTALADALRANARKWNELRAGPAQAGATPPTLSQRLVEQERLFAARLDGIRAVRAAFEGLLAVLSEEQKKIAEEIVPWHGGLMAMGMV